MAHTWILVADASSARNFTSDTHFKELYETQTLDHANSRLHDQDLTTDLPGRSFNSTGSMRHAMEQNTDPKKHEAMAFARELADHFEHLRTENAIDKIVIIASPNMLGYLRNELSKDTSKLVSNEIDKDLTQHSLEDIRQHLKSRVGPR